jgi:hypothetical protein
MVHDLRRQAQTPSNAIEEIADSNAVVSAYAQYGDMSCIPISMFSTQLSKSAPLATVDCNKGMNDSRESQYQCACYLERIQIHNKQVDLVNAMIFASLLMVLVSANRQQTTMHL